MEIKEALEKSIEHWEEVRKLFEDNLGEKISGGQINERRILIGGTWCALCGICFRSDGDCQGDGGCEECPVAKRTGQDGCGGSPYGYVAALVATANVVTEEIIDAVQREVMFLKSLRKDVQSSWVYKGCVYRCGKTTCLHADTPTFPMCTNEVNGSCVFAKADFGLLQSPEYQEFVKTQKFNQAVADVVEDYADGRDLQHIAATLNTACFDNTEDLVRKLDGLLKKKRSDKKE